MKKQVESVDFRVCAAHNVAPIVVKVLGAKEKDLRNEEFVGFTENWGLELGEGAVWEGTQKCFAPKGNKKGRVEQC
jgi:hypothetical protein